MTTIDTYEVPNALPIDRHVRIKTKTKYSFILRKDHSYVEMAPTHERHVFVELGIASNLDDIKSIKQFYVAVVPTIDSSRISNGTWPTIRCNEEQRNTYYLQIVKTLVWMLNNGIKYNKNLKLNTIDINLIATY